MRCLGIDQPIIVRGRGRGIRRGGRSGRGMRENRRGRGRDNVQFISLYLIIYLSLNFLSAEIWLQASATIGQ